MTVWTMEEKDGQVVVSWGRKTQLFSSEAVALAFVNGQRAVKDRVFRIEADGYRTPVIRRRRWRA